MSILTYNSLGASLQTSAKNAKKSLQTCVLILVSVALTTNLKAQEKITYKQSLQIALEKNFNIKIAENTAEIEAKNNSLGNAGFLPTINLNARKSTSSLNSEIELFDGTKINRDGAQTKVLTASLDMNWRLFDGTRMFMAYKRLGILSEIQKEVLKSQINATLAEVSLTFQQLLRLREAVDILAQGLRISHERLQLEQTKLEIGTGSELEVLQAQTDLNADSSAFMRQEIQYTSLKLQFIGLLSLQSKSLIEIQDEEWKSYEFSIDDVLLKVKNQNPELKRLQLQTNEQQIVIRQIQAEYLPELDFNVGYAFNDQEAEASQLRFLTTQGLNYNFTARLNVFQGFNQKRRIDNAKLAMKNNDIRLMQTEMLLENQTMTIWLAYVQSKSIFKLETTNFDAAEKTLGISKEKYNQGLMSAVEFREAQRNWLNARLRLLNAEFDVRVNEVELMRLSGDFVK